MEMYAFELSNDETAYLPRNEEDGNDVTFDADVLWTDDTKASPFETTINYVASQLPEGVTLTGIVSIVHTP